MYPIANKHPGSRLEPWVQNQILNPLTPGTFFAKSAFFGLLGWILAKLPLIWSKMRLQHNSLPFLPPASRFSAL